MSGEQQQVEKDGAQKGDLSELQSVFEDIAKKEGYIDYEIAIAKINSGGANLSGELFEVDIREKSEDGEKETNLFLKKPIDVAGEVFSVSRAYETENFVYQDLAKRFHELQVQANVPEGDRYKIVKYHNNSSSTTIILDNLVKKGFGTPHRMEVVSLKYAQLCMAELAKFHALSFALKIKHHSYFDQKVKIYKESMKINENSRALWKSKLQVAVKNLDPIHVTKAEKALVVFEEKFVIYHNAENSPVTCLCHGDFKPSNILMREKEGEVMEVIPVDYQCIYYGCPINDILYFIMSGTDRQFRAQHLEGLKILYHDTLTNFLKYFHIDSNEIFSRAQMEEIFCQRMDYMPMYAVYAFPFLFNVEIELDVNDPTIMQANFDVDKRYKKRLSELLEEFI